MRALPNADDEAFVAYSIASAHVLCNSSAAAYIEFGMEISLSKSVVLVQGVSDPVTINDVALKVLKSSVILLPWIKRHCVWIPRF